MTFAPTKLFICLFVDAVLLDANIGFSPIPYRCRSGEIENEVRFHLEITERHVYK